ncbi:response regulator [Legionella gresilensis]|uniref:response regulator n=1 Tax=Legionella gresilensis TaxID=91823 RepID=UPI001041234F|nr:response regulator [Legionella gresilensis]
MAKLLSFLVIDSSLSARIIMRWHFTALDYYLDMAWNLESAQDRVRTKHYDFILMDIDLKEVYLIDECKKSSPLNKESQVIYLASSQAKTVIKPREKKVLVLPKPLTKNDTLKMIDYLKTVNESRK